VYAICHNQFFKQIFAQRVNSALADGKQHDAQEFQIYLLDALHEDTNKVGPKLQKKIFLKQFR
jgi:ubiquitin C-terminal hydrolase